MPSDMSNPNIYPGDRDFVPGFTSSEQSDRLKPPHSEVAVDNHTGTKIVEGNRVKLLPSGVSSYRVRWQLMEEAKHSIDIVAFSLTSDETGERLRDMVIKKLRQGVAVRLIFDDGVMTTTFSGSLLNDMAKHGAETIRYHKIFRDIFAITGKRHIFRQLKNNFKLKLKRRFHEKYLIVDGREAVLGGINWGNKYAFGGEKPNAWRDSDVHLTGPIVADVQRQFVKDFFRYDAMDREYEARRTSDFDREAFYQNAREREEAFIRENSAVCFPELPTTGPERIRYIPHKPYDDNRVNLTEAFLLMLRDAQQSVYWGCHGIRPPRILAETLAEAVQRGVEVHLITNSRVSSHALMIRGLLGWMHWESSNHFRWLIERGIRVYEWQKPGAFHSKNFVMDGTIASVGSYNIARGSTFHHTESNIVVYGGEFPRQVRKQFDIDLQDCKEVTLEKAKKTWRIFDPYRRKLNKRNLLIDESLLTEAIKHDLRQDGWLT